MPLRTGYRAMKRYAPPTAVRREYIDSEATQRMLRCPATPGGRKAMLTSEFDLQHGVSY